MGAKRLSFKLSVVDILQLQLMYRMTEFIACYTFNSAFLLTYLNNVVLVSVCKEEGFSLLKSE